jgi:nucleotide-binding universal stress UspA family protein
MIVGYKTILVHCDGGEAVAHRLGVAVGLAQRFDAHLVGLYTRPQFEPPIPFDGGFAMGLHYTYTAFEESVKADQAAALAAFDKATKGAEVSSEWRAVNGFAATELVLAARCADLIVAGQADLGTTRAMPTPSNLVQEVALSASGPVMIVPNVGVRSAPGKTVLLCWKETREAARAVSAALPLLKSAENVIALVADTQRSTSGHAEPGAELALWLSRHGVKVTVRHDVAVGGDVGALILSCAADHGVDLIVMGIYGRSRLQELILGGVSRTLLVGMTVPLLMAH